MYHMIYCQELARLHQEELIAAASRQHEVSKLEWAAHRLAVKVLLALASEMISFGTKWMTHLQGQPRNFSAAMFID